MIIAAVKTREELDAAKQSGVKIIFDLNPDILSLEEVVREAHSCGKRIFLHMDLAEGIGKDKAGLQYEVMNVADHLDLVNQYGIQQAPTMIVRKGGTVEKLVGAGAIKKFTTR